MSSKALPFRPNLDHYRKRAKQLVRAHKAGDLDAGRTLAEHHPRLGPRAEDALAGDLPLEPSAEATLRDLVGRAFIQQRSNDLAEEQLVQAIEIRPSNGEMQT